MDFNHPEILTKGNARVFPKQNIPKLVQGPQQVPKFRAQKWVFQVQSTQAHRITTHHFETPAMKQRAIDEIEFFFRAALSQYVKDGASPDIII